MKLKKGLCMALLALFCFAAAPANSTDLIASKVYERQTKRVTASCFPQRLLGILAFIKKETKRNIILTSGHRPHGPRKSLHRSCRAADIRVKGYSSSALIAIARRAPGIGGIGKYRRKPGLIHVDVGPRREWTH